MSSLKVKSLSFYVVLTSFLMVSYMNCGRSDLGQQTVGEQDHLRAFASQTGVNLSSSPSEPEVLTRGITARLDPSKTIAGNFSVYRRLTPSLSPAEPGQRLSFGTPHRRRYNPGLVKLKDPSANQNWSLSIGKGGQIYAVEVGNSGDLIANQPEDAHWVDRVFQTVATDSSYNRRTPLNRRWFLHQAGTYQRDILKNKAPYFSPMVWQRRSPSNGIMEYINMPQMAHVPHPSYRPERVMIYTRVRNVGEGAVEITYTWCNHSYNGRVLDHFNFPWSVYKNDLTPSLRAGRLSGTGSQALARSNWPNPNPPKSISSINGWFSIFNTRKPGSNGMSVVMDFAGKLNYGKVGSRNILVMGNVNSHLENREKIRIARGEAIESKVRVVFGTVRSGVMAKANKLAREMPFSTRVIKRTSLLDMSPNFVAICRSNKNYACATAAQPDFYLLGSWVPDSVPVFEITQNGVDKLTTDPYLGNHNKQYLLKKKTTFNIKRLIGWTLSSSKHADFIRQEVVGRCTPSPLSEPNFRVIRHSSDPSDLLRFKDCQ